MGKHAVLKRHRNIKNDISAEEFVAKMKNETSTDMLARVYEKYIFMDISQSVELFQAIKDQLEEDIQRSKLDPNYEFRSTGVSAAEFNMLKLITNKDAAIVAEVIQKAIKFLHEYAFYKLKRIEAEENHAANLARIKESNKEEEWDDKKFRQELKEKTSNVDNGV